MGSQIRLSCLFIYQQLIPIPSHVDDADARDIRWTSYY